MNAAQEPRPADGILSSCDSPGSISCLNYATCATEAMCVDTCPAPPSEQCNGWTMIAMGKPMTCSSAQRGLPKKKHVQEGVGRKPGPVPARAPGGPGRMQRGCLQPGRRSERAGDLRELRHSLPFPDLQWMSGAVGQPGFLGQGTCAPGATGPVTQGCEEQYAPRAANG